MISLNEDCCPQKEAPKAPVAKKMTYEKSFPIGNSNFKVKEGSVYEVEADAVCMKGTLLILVNSTDIYMNNMNSSLAQKAGLYMHELI